MSLRAGTACCCNWGTAPAATASTILLLTDWQVLAASVTSSTLSVVVSGNSASSQLSHLITSAADDWRMTSSALHVTSGSSASGSTLTLTLAVFLTDDDVRAPAADVLRRLRILCTTHTTSRACTAVTSRWIFRKACSQHVNWTQARELHCQNHNGIHVWYTLAEWLACWTQAL